MKAGLLLAGLIGAGVAVWVVLAGAQTSRHILLTDAVARPLGDGTIAAFVKIENRGAPDRLISASGAAGMDVALYSPKDRAGPPVPTGTASLAPDAAHIRIASGTPLKDGSLVPLTLQFEKAGEVSLRVRLSDPAADPMSEVGLFGMGDICVVGGDEPAPAIGLAIEEDAGGWNVRVLTEDFTFSKDLVDLYHVPGMGHGHLYVGGIKLGRLYTPEARIGALPKGTHEVRVTLNTNDHRAYVVDDVPVTAAAVIVVD
ncbi:MAG: copper chaperone PCu(A)C [Pseudomonadota bacterium]